MNNTETHRIIRKELKDLLNYIESIQDDPFIGNEVSFNWKLIKEDKAIIIHLELNSFTPIKIKMKIGESSFNKEDIINVCNYFKRILFRRALLGRY